MNKSDLVDALSEETNQTKSNIKAVLDSLEDIIVTQVSEGSDVVFSKLGRFTSGDRAARKGRNPQTGEVIDIPAATLPKFKPGKYFKNAVNVNT